MAFTIHITRDSVAMGDDSDAPHAYSFSLSKTATLKDVFDHLAQNHYLAFVSGKNHMWQAYINHKIVGLIHGNEQKPQPSAFSDQTLGHFALQNTIRLHFEYISAPD